MTIQMYPIVAVVRNLPGIHLSIPSSPGCPRGLVVAGTPSKGLIVSETTVVV